jgi:4,5-dihydroxyphthalate decarboxylase
MQERDEMTTQTAIDVLLEAQGSLPNYRYDILQPLLQGRVPIEGVTLKTTGPADAVRLYQDERLKAGDFGLLDTNWGDAAPAIDAGWEIACLPVFIKRKPVYNFLWVRADRGINAPKDLEGKLIATGGYTSAITIYTRGFLQHFHGVDISKLRWLLPAPPPLPLHTQGIAIDVATGPRKAPVQRLLDGEVDASTGDITDAKIWVELESNPNVRRMFPNYQEENERLWREHHIFTPVHMIFISRKLDREHPGLARRLYEAFNQSTEMAIADAQGDGTSYSLIINMRELLRQQLHTWGNVYAQGISANRDTIDAFLDYCAEQGVTGRRLSNEQFFASGTLDT